MARDVAVQLGVAPEDGQAAVEAVGEQILDPLMEEKQPGDLILIVTVSTQGMPEVAIPFMPVGHLMRVRDGVWEVIRVTDF